MRGAPTREWISRLVNLVAMSAYLAAPAWTTIPACLTQIGLLVTGEPQGIAPAGVPSYGLGVGAGLIRIFN